MDKHIPEINGALLRMRREELGWALADLATRACLSNKQVKQIEEGGTSSFYSESVKATAAKKIGGILGLPEQSVFVMDIPELEEADGDDHQHSPQPSGEETHSETSTKSLSHASEENATSSDLSHVAKDEIASPATKPYLKSPSLETTVIHKSTNSALDSEEQPKSKNSLWFIIALFVAALGLAAVMQKQPAPTQPVEPPPPIQVLPPEQPDPNASAPVATPAPVASSATVAPSAAATPSATAAPATVNAPAAQTPSTAPASSTVNTSPAPRPSVGATPTTAPTPAVSVAPAATPSTPPNQAPAATSASKPQ
jgi:transcriptional regulator with XRE-family HTH domain